MGVDGLQGVLAGGVFACPGRPTRCADRRTIFVSTSFRNYVFGEKMPLVPLSQHITTVCPSIMRPFSLNMSIKNMLIFRDRVGGRFLQYTSYTNMNSYAGSLQYFGAS